MKRLWWRTGQPIKYSQPVVRPADKQLLRQVAALLVVVALWGGGFLILLGATKSSTLPVPPSTVTTPVSFQRDVLPILTRVCVKCHGGERTQKSLVLKSYDDLMQGSENGPVVVPGDPSNSLLVQMVAQGKLPKSGPKLLPRQIQTIIDWIQAGASDN